MRVLTTTLNAAQKAAVNSLLARVVLTHDSDSYTYTTSRIIDIKHREAPWSQKATILLNNADNVLSTIDLKAFQAVLGYGFTTSGGAEYSDCAPLWVINQPMSSVWGDLTCKLECVGLPDLLALDKASASYEPTSSDTDTVKDLLDKIFGATLDCYSHCTAYTVTYDSEDSLIDTFQPKDTFRIYEGGSRLAAARRLIDYTGCAIRWHSDGTPHVFTPITSVTQGLTSPTGASGTGWNNTAYAWDGNAGTAASEVIQENSWGNYLILTFPLRTASAFKITWGNLAGTIDQYDLDYYYAGAWHDIAQTDISTSPMTVSCPPAACTQARIRFHNSHVSNDAAMYVYEFQYYWDYDYEYSLASGYHNFFSKTYQQRLVIPNKITVKSQTGDSPAYTGNATDSESYALKPIDDFIQTRLASNAQATSIAEAKIIKAQLQADGGSGLVPMNVNAEVYDYVKVTDARENDSRMGNTGWIERRYTVPLGKKEGKWEMGFGFGGWASFRGFLDDLETNTDLGQSLLRLYAKDAYIERLQAGSIDLTTLDQDDIQDGTTYGRVKNTHLDSNGVKISSVTTFDTNYDPSSKKKVFVTTPTTPYYLGDTWKEAGTFKICTTARATGAYVAGDWASFTQDDIISGSSFRRVQSAALSEAGLVLLDQVTTGTYGLVLSADISAGHILMTAVSGDLDDISNGTTYGKVNLTAISAGNILLSTTVDDSTHRLVTDTEKSTYAAKTKVFRQATAPSTGMQAGDIWIDTDDGDKPYTYGTEWVASYTQISGGSITTGTLDCTKVTVSSVSGSNSITLNTSGILCTGTDLTFAPADGGAERATIYTGNSGQLALSPETSKYAICMENFGLVGEYTFGLLLATGADSFLSWFDNGTRDHHFQPQTTGHGYLGDTTNEWKGIYVQTVYTDNIVLDTSLLPDAAGGADIGSATLPIGTLWLGDTYNKIGASSGDMDFSVSNTAGNASVLAMYITDGDVPELNLDPAVFLDLNGSYIKGWNTQSTVGGAGGASALPATPTGYAHIKVGATTYQVPYYATS